MNEKPEVTRCGLLDMQVCVPDVWSDQQVKEFADVQNPSGISAGWVIRKQGDLALGGDNERTSCNSKDRVGFVHIVLDA